MTIKGKGFLFELRRRRVLPIAGAYLVVAWLAAEIAGFLLEQASAPGWTLRLLAIALVVGFPVAVMLAWIIQRQPDGKWAFDSSKGRGQAAFATVLLGFLITAGLAWLILPQIEDAPTAPDYRPIPNSIALLPLAGTVETRGERAIAETLLVALGAGLDQAEDLIVLDLRKLDEQPDDLIEFGRSIKAAAMMTGKIFQVAGGTRIQLELIDIGRSVATWSRAFDWDPTRVADTGLAIANDVLGAMELPALSRVRFIGTDNAEAYEAYLSGGRHAASLNIALLATAIEDFQRAIDLDPDYVLAYVALAETLNWYRRRTRPVEAEAQALQDRARHALEVALELDPQSAAAISLLGLFSGDEDLAIQAYEHALELDPNHAKSYYRLGWALQKQNISGLRSGNLDETERLFRKALDLDPFNADWHKDLATLLYDVGREEEAFAEMKRSIELEPMYLENHIQLGFWEYYENGRLDEAMIRFRKAYAIDPKYSHAAWSVAGAYAEFGAGKEALAWMQRSLELGPGNALTWFVAYQIYYWLGYEDEAMEAAERSLELYPTEFALLHVGTWDIREGRAEEALERWRLAYPRLTESDEPVIEPTDIRPALYYARNLKDAGQIERGERILHQCLDALAKWQSETYVNRAVALDLEQEIFAALELKEETLAAMRTAIIDHQNYSGQWMYAFPQFDFLREEPGFQELMAILHAKLAQQYERIREMERNGEMPPAPGVELHR